MLREDESLEQRRAVVAQSPLFDRLAVPQLLLLPEEGRVYRANRAAQQHLGYSESQLQQMPLSEFLVEIQQGIPAEFLRIADPEANYHFIQARKASGEHRHLFAVLTELPDCALHHLIYGDNTDLYLARRMLTELIAGTARLTGEEYLRGLLEQAARLLNVRYAYLGEVVPGEERVRGLLYWADGEFQTPLDYDLRGTPCENVVAREACLYARNVQQLFPDDAELRQLGAESYMGVPLRDSKGRTCGLIWFADTKPMPEVPVLLEVLTLLAERASAELERRRIEGELQAVREQLFQAQKMESIGQMAGGIAHDFNNLLTAILGYVELAQASLPENSKENQYLQNAIRAIEKATDFTRQLMTFARRQPMQLQSVNLAQIEREAEPMMHRWMPTSIRIQTFLPDDLWLVEADPALMTQVLYNLALNARDAMPQGGTLTIELANVSLDTEYANSHYDVQPGDYVMLAVSDTGVGMTPEVQRRIFEPFFTTKPPGQGSGMGLATVYSIVKQLGGHIWVYTEVGRGTTFKIYLPRAHAQSETPVATLPPPLVQTGTETILLVEDEEAVRAVASESLRMLGYTVLEAGTPAEALHIAQSHPEPIQLLLTDVVLPTISGRELAEIIKRLHPEIKVLYVSGYTENTIVHHGVLEEGIHFLPKPYTPSQLAAKVRQVLDSLA
jgi:signal transduction histidine kinase/CheY-like chemotaxis protein